MGESPFGTASLPAYKHGVGGQLSCGKLGCISTNYQRIFMNFPALNNQNEDLKMSLFGVLHRFFYVFSS